MSRLLPWTKSSWPGTESVLDGFERPKLARLRLERFARGNDNYHIDVALGAPLTNASRAYVKALVREYVQHLWKHPVQAYSESIVDRFRRVIGEHHNAVVKQARSGSRVERVQLFELALLSLLLGQVDAELSTLRFELEEARSLPTRQINGKSLELHHQAVILARKSSHVRYLAARHIIRELLRIEHSRLRKMRKAVLGISWPVPESMLANPLLQLEGSGDPRDFSRIYPLLLHDTDAAMRINGIMIDLLSPWLPAAMTLPPERPPQASYLPGVNRQGQGSPRALLETERRVRHLFAQSELADEGANWTDEPDNICALLGGDAEPWPHAYGWRQTGIERLQRDLNSDLERRMRRTGDLQAVRAGYELNAIYPTLGLIDSEALLYEYFKGDTGRAELKRRLGNLDGVNDAGGLVRRIDRLRKEYAQKPALPRRQLVARFAADFMRLRRDLKFAWRALVAMDSIRLVDDAQELAAAGESRTLQRFCCDDVALAGRGTVVGHVIIKIDLRGASEITAQMRRRNMNPASHFSRYFFDPITRSLQRFAAQKVAVEGDAVMLAVIEQGSETNERLAVARASCLAARILGFVDAMNAENARIDLPLVEVGMGVAYADEAPTYLYDHGRKVTISPAINEARRLSSCHALLRQTCPLEDSRGLCVATPVYGDEDESADTLVRANVNAIELDDAAFTQLHVELSMRRLTMRDRKSRKSETLYVGHCADALGDSHLLVVRERRIKLWMGKQLLDAPQDGRRFYEVVSDERLIARIAERVSDQRDSTVSPAPAVRPLPGDGALPS